MWFGGNRKESMKPRGNILCAAALLILMTPALMKAQAEDIYGAAKEGDLTSVQAFVTTNLTMVNAQDVYGNTPLLWP